MLLAIDVGNSDTKFGFSNGHEWLGVWRRPTHPPGDASQIAQWLGDNLSKAGIPLQVERVACVSVVPENEQLITDLSSLVNGKEPVFLHAGLIPSLKIFYEPQDSVGADRLANVLGALKQYPAPLIVVDFGTATTLDVCSEEGFLGGAILPGVKLQIASLAQRTSKLSEVEATAPQSAIGQSTTAAVQSGVVLGHVAAVEGLIAKIQKELPLPATVLGTGGLAHLFMGQTPAIHHFVPQLTLEGALSLLGEG